MGHLAREEGLLGVTEISVQDALGSGAAVGLAAAGDEVAFARLIAAHDDSMRRVAFVIAGDWETAGEAVQAAWVLAWKRLRTLRHHDRVEPWLVSIAANETRRLLSRQRRRTVVEIDAGREAAAAFGRDPGDVVGLMDLGRALGRLRPDERGLIAMRYVAGLDSGQIGAVTGMSASGVRTRLARLLERLRVDLDG
jgi:RNA polymerase sigma-70 factor (ECF subfamily)